MRIALYASNGGFVFESTIPPFAPPPDAIEWRGRTYIRNDAFEQLVGTAGYVECFLYVIQDVRLGDAIPEAQVKA